MQLFDQIAARIFGPGKSDASPANAQDGKMPVGVRTRSSAPEEAPAEEGESGDAGWQRHGWNGRNGLLIAPFILENKERARGRSGLLKT
jgi:hypothetical protein